MRAQDQEEEEEDDDDRLSALPDDLLLDILERMCLRSAVRTSALSRRWRRLPLLLSHLVIDIDEFRRGSGTRTVQSLMASYTQATERLLAPTSERAVKDLRLAFFLCTDLSYLRSIGQAVAMAFESHTHTAPELVYLTLFTAVRSSQCTEEHAAFYGRRFRSFLDACPSAFRCLTSLTLRNLQFEESDILNILSACDKLTELCLKYCGRTPDLKSFPWRVLRIDAPNSQLVTLRIVKCKFSRVDIICAPRLARLAYEPWQFEYIPPLSFGHVPQLRQLYLASTILFWEEPFALSACLSNTKSLSAVNLDFKDEMIWIRPEDPKLLAPMFSNLKMLRLEDIFPGCDLKWTLLYVAAAPSLDSFYVKISRHICGRYKVNGIAKKTNVLREAHDFKHCNLHVLDIEGFQAEERLISFTRLVMERAINLKKIRLHGATDECIHCDRLRGRTAISAWNDGIKNLVRDQIADGSPLSSIEISVD